jgi:hypothetical protein
MVFGTEEIDLAAVEQIVEKGLLRAIAPTEVKRLLTWYL